MTEERIGSSGVSASTQGNQANAKRICNEFLLANDYNQQWDELSETTLTSPEFYERLAYYLAKVYKISGNKNNGEFLKVNVIKSYLNIMIKLAQNKLLSSTNAETKLFFTCLLTSSNSFHANWLRGVRHNIDRICLERMKEAGDDYDESAPPMSRENLKLMIQAYWKANTNETGIRVLSLLTLFFVGGRSSEPAWMDIKNMSWSMDDLAVDLNVYATRLYRSNYWS